MHGLSYSAVIISPIPFLLVCTAYEVMSVVTVGDFNRFSCLLTSRFSLKPAVHYQAPSEVNRGVLRVPRVLDFCDYSPLPAEVRRKVFSV